MATRPKTPQQLIEEKRKAAGARTSGSPPKGQTMTRLPAPKPKPKTATVSKRQAPARPKTVAGRATFARQSNQGINAQKATARRSAQAKKNTRARTGAQWNKVAREFGKPTATASPRVRAAAARKRKRKATTRRK